MQSHSTDLFIFDRIAHKILQAIFLYPHICKQSSSWHVQGSREHQRKESSTPCGVSRLFVETRWQRMRMIYRRYLKKPSLIGRNSRIIITHGATTKQQKLKWLGIRQENLQVCCMSCVLLLDCTLLSDNSLTHMHTPGLSFLSRCFSS